MTTRPNFTMIVRGGKKVFAMEKSYPNLAYWIEAYGWIEMGENDFSTSLIRILDIGGMIWES